MQLETEQCKYKFAKKYLSATSKLVVKDTMTESSRNIRACFPKMCYTTFIAKLNEIFAELDNV